MNLFGYNANLWDFFVNTGGVAALLALATSQNVEAQKSSIKELAKLSETFCSQISDSKQGVAPLILLLSSPEKTVQESATIVISNLSTEEKNLEHIVVGTSQLVAMMGSTKEEVQFHAARALANLAVKETYHTTILGANAIPRVIGT